MSNLIKNINVSDCVGDSLGKHNYNFLSLDLNVCNLSSIFFNVNNNYFNTFSDLSANIKNFNSFADVFEYPFDLNKSTTATKFLSSYWQKKDISLTFPININTFDDAQLQYIDEKTSNDNLKNWGINQLNRKYPIINLINGSQNYSNQTTATVCFLLYSNLGKVYTPVETSTLQLASDTSPKITRYLKNGTHTIPTGVNSIDLLLVAGGGGGGGEGQRSGGGGGGGGGIVYVTNFTVTPNTTYNITIGNGGIGGGPYSYGSVGGNTTFGSLVAYGGKGGHSSVGGDLVGGDAGSGNSTGNGGRGQYASQSNVPPTNGGNGFLLAQTKEYFGGGGGGGNDYMGPTYGGLGGGGIGGHSSYANGISDYSAGNGEANTGGGGGGAARNQGTGARGGSGIVIVIQKQTATLTQTNKVFNVTQRKDDCYIKGIKLAKYKIDPQTKSWTFLNFL
jgi:hypothetical protein